MITERPILFSTPMVQAILDGRKTQTRRVVKFPENVRVETVNHWSKAPVAGYGIKGEFVPLNINGGISTKAFYEHSIKCPYGQPGDRQWVRETWQGYRQTSYEYDEWEEMESPKDRHEQPYSPVYKADGKNFPEKWQPSIFMPREFSRIDLLIEDIRVERLQDISAEDALAEGIERNNMGLGNGETYKDYIDCPNDKWEWFGCPINSFQSLWDSINGKTYPWKSNPWLWVIEFSRIKP